jgi:cold shock protein
MRSKEARGFVEAWYPDVGWGVLASSDLPHRVWAHFSAIDATGFRELRVGDQVEFRYRAASQDGFSYVAESVRRLEAVRLLGGALGPPRVTCGRAVSQKV